MCGVPEARPNVYQDNKIRKTGSLGPQCSVVQAEGEEEILSD
jgi:hypothetical protein